jgi:hypothetical protein
MISKVSTTQLDDIEYVVCSDESGVWNSNSCDNYIRVFCIFREEELLFLQQEYIKKQKVISKKHPSDFSLIINLIEEYNIFVEIYVYFNLTCDEKSGTEKAKNIIDSINFPTMSFINDKELIEALKDTFDNLYYLNYIESHFFDNFISDSNIKIDQINYFKIENPQFVKKRFKAFFKNKFKTTQLELYQKSKNEVNCVGTQLCDRVGSLYQNELNTGIHKNKKETIWVRSKLGKPKYSNCNPSKVFFVEVDKTKPWYKNLKTKKWKH